MSDRIYDDKLNPRDAKLLKVVLSDFFGGSVKFDLEEGQGVDDKGVVTLGCRAGPSLDIFNLFHEMSHLVEIDDARAGAWGWGLSFGKEISIPGYGTFHEPQTWQATQRETRVMAFQANVMLHYQRRPNFRYFAKLCDHLVDYYNVPFKRETRHRLLAERIAKLAASPKYSFERFRSEWARKNGLLKEK